MNNQWFSSSVIINSLTDQALDPPGTFMALAHEGQLRSSVSLRDVGFGVFFAASDNTMFLNCKVNVIYKEYIINSTFILLYQN